MHLSSILFTCILAPLAGAIIVGILGRRMGDKWSHALTILGMAVSFCCALYLFVQMVVKGAPDYNSNIYAWGMGENFHFTIGFLLDRLTAVMIVTVTFVSLLVHVYSYY